MGDKERRVATSAEVEEAVSALSVQDRKHLQEYAENLPAWLFDKGGFTPESLISEACSRTVEGRYSWRLLEIPLVRHLREVVRSIKKEVRDKHLQEATQAEIQAATENLSRRDYDRLHAYATEHFDWRQNHGGLPPEELITEAITRTADEKQTWRPEERDFISHLFNAIRSITGHDLDGNQDHLPYDELTSKGGEGVHLGKEEPAELAWDDFDALKQSLSLNPEEENLVKDIHDGYSKTEIARRLDRSDVWVTRRCSALGFRIARNEAFRETLSDNPRLYRLAGLLHEKRSNAEICQLLPCSKAELKKLKSELGIRFLAFLGTL